MHSRTGFSALLAVLIGTVLTSVVLSQPANPEAGAGSAPSMTKLTKDRLAAAEMYEEKFQRQIESLLWAAVGKVVVHVSADVDSEGGLAILRVVVLCTEAGLKNLVELRDRSQEEVIESLTALIGAGFPVDPSAVRIIVLDRFADEGRVTLSQLGNAYDAMFKAVIEAATKGEVPDAAKIGDEIAKKAGFKDWADFNSKAAQSLGGEQFQLAVSAATNRYERALKKALDDKMKSAAGGDNKPR